jgi:hypothetical protein
VEFSSLLVFQVEFSLPLSATSVKDSASSVKGSSSSASVLLVLLPPNLDEVDRNALLLLSFNEYPSLKSKTPLSSCSF